MLKKEDLINYFTNYSQKKLIGIEIEKFIYNKDNYNPVSFLQIQNIYKSLNTKTWNLVEDGGSVYGASSSFANLSLEPGLQFEYSSLPEADINTLDKNFNNYLAELLPILDSQNLGLFLLGHHPFLTPEETPLIPNKERYKIMYDYFPKVATLGRNMMKNTGTLQVNLDYNSESNLRNKLMLISKMTPLLILLGANSPFYQGKTAKYLSFRTHVLNNTDPARYGIPEFFMDGSFSIEKYVDYLLDVPMFFIIRNNKHLPLFNLTFKDALEGKIEGINKEDITLDDFETHITTVYPDIRIKKYLEIRSIDATDKEYIPAISAFLVGLLYDENSLTRALDIFKDTSYTSLLKEKDSINKLEAFDDKVQSVLLSLYDLAALGLKARGLNEEDFLNPLKDLIENKTTLAQSKIKLFNSVNKDIKEVIKNISLK